MPEALPPDVAAVRDWLGGQNLTVPDELVAECLDVALEQQADACVVDPYTSSLRYAALRRTARIIAARPHALGTIDAGDFGVSRLSRWDAEVTAAESPYLRGGFA